MPSIDTAPAVTSPPSSDPAGLDDLRLARASRRHGDVRVQRLIALYEDMTPESLPLFRALYTPSAHFKDPFHTVQGVDAIEAIFRRMFESVESPRFTVHTALAEGPQCFLTWDFDFIRRGQTLRIHGGSHLLFDLQGRVALHRDYWDVAEELYEKLPVVGAFMRWMKRRAAS